MLLLRTLFFKIYVPFWTGLSSTVFFPLLFMGYKMASFAGWFWGIGIVYGSKVICGIDFVEEGKENLPKEGGFILACKHQSVWDTAIFLVLLKYPVYILKKELLRIPFFGFFLRAIRMIAIDRNGKSATLKKMLEDVKDRLAHERPIIIFPEGTRTLPGEHKPYQPGVAFIYLDKEVDVPIIPVSLNSGKFWSPKRFMNYPGTIRITYHAPIEKGLNRKQFMKKLEEAVESAS